MDKITISPKKVRGLGNIVSQKVKTDFLGGKVTSSTESVNGISSTVFTSSHLLNGNITISCNHVVGVLTNFTLTATLTDSTNTPVNNVKLYCEVNGETYSGNTNSNGVRNFNITGLPTGTYNCHVYYPGSNTVGGCFKDFQVTVSDAEWELRVCGKSIIQKDEGVYIAGILTTDGMGVAGQLVEFYEEYDVNIDIQAPSSVVGVDDVVDITARLFDEDRSLVSGETIYFYEVYEVDTITVKSNKSVIVTDEYSDITVTLKDDDGSLIQGETVYFYVKEED